MTFHETGQLMQHSAGTYGIQHKKFDNGGGGCTDEHLTSQGRTTALLVRYKNSLLSSVKKMRSFTFILPLLSELLSICGGDVGDFSPCLNYFYRACPPRGISGIPICQRYENRYHFATLYSHERRTPWFSAYVYSPPKDKRPKSVWKYEPQLANSHSDGNMVPFPPPPEKVDQNVVESQAVQQDYINSTYTRGHLSPSLHHRDSESRNATFTLTNIVPQRAGSNNGPWARLEAKVSKSLAAHCLGDAHVVTGVIPYMSERWLKDENRVAVPEYLWSAYCCWNYTQDLPKSLANMYPAFAAIGRNDPDSSEEIVPVDRCRKKAELGYDVRTMALSALEMYLTQRYGVPVGVFHKQCTRSEPSGRSWEPV
ncbi:endonuclease domain-containing 1 protein-like isoform X1 [Electrophorus electricus]|nr:endonuclease domain-containing 1 protein-like isoform X1 [Electrophorus electricus]